MRQYISNNIRKSPNLKNVIVRPKSFNHELPIKQVSRAEKYSSKSKKMQAFDEDLVNNQSAKLPKLVTLDKANMKFFSIDSKTCAQYAYLSSLNEQPNNNLDNAILNNSVSKVAQPQYEHMMLRTALLDMMLINYYSIQTSAINNQDNFESNYNEKDTYDFTGNININESLDNN